MKLHVVAVPQYRHHEPSGGCHCNRDVDVVATYDFGSVNDTVDNRKLLQSHRRCLQKEGHETQLNSIFLKEVLP